MAGQTAIAKFLKSKGSTQNEAAELLGISIQSFSNKALGKFPFKQYEIKNLIQHYNMNASEVYDVFFGEGE